MGFGGFGGGEEMMMLGCMTNPNCMSNPMMSMGMLSGSSDTMRNMIMIDQARKGRVDPLLMMGGDSFQRIAMMKHLASNNGAAGGNAASSAAASQSQTPAPATSGAEQNSVRVRRLIFI